MSIQGQIIDEFKIVSDPTSGQIGSVYRAVQEGEIQAERALKLIPYANLKEGWQNEINKVNAIQEVDHVVPYKANGTWEYDGVEYLWIAWKYIHGRSLRDLLSSGDVDMQILKDVIIAALKVLHACTMRGVEHGDLHAGNIMIADPNDLEIDPNIRKVWITDFGYLTSSMGKEMLDDFIGLKNILGESLAAIDFHGLEGHDKFIYKKIKREYLRLLEERNVVEGAYVRSPRDLLREFQTLQAKQPAEDSVYARKVGDYLAAETLGGRFEYWAKLFVPRVVGSDLLLSRNICVFTGLRGCGKTMVFRRLTAMFDMHLGKLDLGASDSFLGFYLNARSIAEAFPWLPVEREASARNQVIHYFHASWVCEILDWLACYYSERPPSQSWLIDFFSDYFDQKTFFSLDGHAAIHHLKAYFTKEKARARVGADYVENGWELSGLNFLEEFCLQIRKSLNIDSNDTFYFFFDDYSTPLVSKPIQHILNPITFRRSSELFFKIATESIESIELVGLNLKSLEQDNDFILIDSATESLKRSSIDNEKMVKDLFQPRIDWDERLQGRSLSLNTILGKTSLNNNELAERLKRSNVGGTKRVEYSGVSVFCGMWQSNTRELISIFSDIINSVESSFFENKSEIPSTKQDKVFRESGSKYRALLASATNPFSDNSEAVSPTVSYGEHLQKIADAFSKISSHELNTKQIKNQDRRNPKQARRIEISDAMEDLPPTEAAYYRGLVRYGLFIRDWRGKSISGGAVPRLYLKSILIPYYTLTFSRKDSIFMKWDQFKSMLAEPDEFAEEWVRGKPEVDVPNLSQPELDLGIK